MGFLRIRESIRFVASWYLTIHYRRSRVNWLEYTFRVRVVGYQVGWHEENGKTITWVWKTSEKGICSILRYCLICWRQKCDAQRVVYVQGDTAEAADLLQRAHLLNHSIRHRHKFPPQYKRSGDRRRPHRSHSAINSIRVYCWSYKHRHTCTDTPAHTYNTPQCTFIHVESASF